MIKKIFNDKDAKSIRKDLKMNKEFILGCHVSSSSPDYYLGSVNEALSYGANTFMIYTSPQNSYRLPTERLNINKGKEALKKWHE